jgi:hypothetical protein
MRKPFPIISLVICLSGCTVPAWSPPPPEMMPVDPTVAASLYPNPVFIPISDPQCAWEAVVDVVDDYFKIQHEEPVRQIGGTITEGRIESFPEVSPTLLEPWRHDNAGEYEQVENTLQTMQRRALVRMLPGEGGYWVSVAIFKELEDLPRPEQATAGGATFRYDSSFTRVVNPSAGGQPTQGWIPKGRDPLLEQKIVGHLINNCSEMGYFMQTQSSGF